MGGRDRKDGWIERKMREGREDRLVGGGGEERR
jgi:hypothetical protein